MTHKKKLLNWILRRRKFHFTLNEAVEANGIPRSAAVALTLELRRAHIIVVVNDDRAKRGRKRSPDYLPNPSFATIALKSRIKELLAKPKRRPGRGRDKIWKAVRISERLFNTKGIIRLSGQPHSTVISFLRDLEKSGYLRREGLSKQDGITWLLVKDPGPTRPALTEKPKPKEA